MNKTIITGTGRCGTMYIKAILRVCGINCGHQEVFRHEHTLKNDWDWGDFEADSSFEAVPLLGEVKKREPDTKVIYLMRNRDQVISSWLKLGLFQDDMETEYEMFSKVLKKYCPTVFDEQMIPYARGGEYYDRWFELAEPYVDHVYEFISKIDPESIFELMNISHKYDKDIVKYISKETNSYKTR